MTDYYNEQICESSWHDEGHSFHSTCSSCGGKGMRASVERRIREDQERFERDAEKWARKHGWLPPLEARRSAAEEPPVSAQGRQADGH